MIAGINENIEHAVRMLTDYVSAYTTEQWHICGRHMGDYVIGLGRLREMLETVVGRKASVENWASDAMYPKNVRERC